MNYYYRYLGDYAKDTTHLTLMQNGAYNFLLDRYYATEKGIPTDEVYLVCRANSKDERKAVDKVLKEFFKLRGGTWSMPKCDKEITKARHRIESARENGKRGGRPKTQREPNGLAESNQNESYLISNLQSSIIRKESEGQKWPIENRKPELDRQIAVLARGRKIKEST